MRRSKAMARLWAGLVAGLILLAACTPTSTPTPATRSGAEIFAETCVVCHGERGQGGVGPPLDATGHAWHHPDQQMRDWIENGKLGFGSSMPAYGDRLTPEEIASVMEYIRSLWTEEQRRLQADITSRYPTQ